MEQIRVFGSDDSVYVRIVRLALHEKGAAYELIPIDVFAEGGPPAAHLERHPFGRIPAFAHGEFRLYETGAITRYIDEALPGPTLQGGTPRDRARVNQLISIADSYLYPTLVWDIFVERVWKPLSGSGADEARIASALGKAVTCLHALTALMGAATWLAGPAPTLADLYAAPMIDLFQRAPEGRNMLKRYPALSAWWARIDERPSLRMTRPTA